MMPKYLVDTISMFRLRYVIECKEEEHALDEVTWVTTGGEVDLDVWQEFSQQHIGENIISSREITDEEYLDLFDKDNDYLKEWTIEQKMKFVNTVDYDKLG
jgi:hypothetical protein